MQRAAPPSTESGRPERPSQNPWKRAVVREMAARHPDIIRIWVDDFFGATEVKSDFPISQSVFELPGPLWLRPWKRTLSASDSGPTPRRAKSDFLSWSSIMGHVTTKDGVEIFYKDWGPKSAQPIAFHHGWPLSSDDWDAQMLFFVSKGYRVVAHDRRGHGRSTQVSDGHDMDHYAADAAARGRSSRFAQRHPYRPFHRRRRGCALRCPPRGKGRVAKAVLVSSVPR